MNLVFCGKEVVEEEEEEEEEVEGERGGFVLLILCHRDRE